MNGVPIFSPEIRFNEAKITFYDQKMIFLTQNYTLYIFQPFFTKKMFMSLIFQDLSFEKNTAAIPPPTPREPILLKGPVKLIIKQVKIAHSFLQSVSDQFHVMTFSLPM